METGVITVLKINLNKGSLINIHKWVGITKLSKVKMLIGKRTLHKDRNATSIKMTAVTAISDR